MKVYLQWKDPDFVVDAIVDGKRVVDFHKLPDNIQDRLIDLGVSEYLGVVVDTETGHVKVSRP